MTSDNVTDVGGMALYIECSHQKAVMLFTSLNIAAIWQNGVLHKFFNMEKNTLINIHQQL